MTLWNKAINKFINLPLPCVMAQKKVLENLDKYQNSALWLVNHYIISNNWALTNQKTGFQKYLWLEDPRYRQHHAWEMCFGKMTGFSDGRHHHKHYRNWRWNLSPDNLGTRTLTEIRLNVLIVKGIFVTRRIIITFRVLPPIWKTLTFICMKSFSEGIR